LDTLSLHDALPISTGGGPRIGATGPRGTAAADPGPAGVLADRGTGHGADQRLDDPADRPAHPRLGVRARRAARRRPVPVRAVETAGRPGGAAAAGGAGADRADRAGPGHDGRLP